MRLSEKRPAASGVEVPTRMVSRSRPGRRTQCPWLSAGPCRGYCPPGRDLDQTFGRGAAGAYPRHGLRSFVVEVEADASAAAGVLRHAVRLTAPDQTSTPRTRLKRVTSMRPEGESRALASHRVKR